MDNRHGWRSWVAGLPAWAFLVAILEMVFMGGPFAAYFYAAYSPILAWTDASPALLWLSEFFAPHLSISSAGWLGKLTRVGQTLFPLGLVSFLIHAGYLYWTKFVRHGVATKLLYRYVRHPQYTSLAVSGAGLVFLWPRFLTLLLFLVMLLGYWALARNEESRMERSHGAAYLEYRNETAALIPGLKWIPPRPAHAALAWALVAGLSLGGALLLRGAAVSALSTEQTSSGIVLYLDRPAGVGSETIARLETPVPRDAVPLFYVLEGRDRLRHFLIDAGVRVGDSEESIPDARWYVVEATVRPPCSTDVCAANVLDARALRRFAALHYVDADGACVRTILPASAFHAHARLPVL